MAQDDSIKGIGQSVLPVDPVKEAAASAGKAGKDAAKKTDETGQEEFLQLLVHQLENQDPLNPMENQEFAVQLAQFSQLEQLIDMNNKMGEGGIGGESSAVGSMASYLGHEAVLSDGMFRAQGGRGSNISLDVPQGTQSLRVDFINEEGAVAGRHTVEDVEAGAQVMSLEGLDVADGSYGIRVVSVDSGGQFVDLDAKATETVEGFVLEPQPMLLVGGQEVSLEDVVEVRKGKTS